MWPNKFVLPDVNKMQRYDVIVIGAGLAGLQCARLLGKDGLRVLLVDRKATLADSVHTTGIFVRRTLEDFDLPEDCLGPAVQHVTLYSPARRSLKLESQHAEFRVGRMAELYEHYLHDARRAGVAWMPGTRYVDYVMCRKKMIVRLEARGYVRWVETKFLVGADGAQSRVARDLALEQNSEWIVGVEEVFRGVPLEGPPRFHCFLDPKRAPGYLAWVINDGGETHVGVGGYAARFDPLKALESFRASVTPSIVDLSKAERLERRGGRIPVGGVLRRLVTERGLLIGDAAGAVSPLTAGGLDPCMRLSTIAAGVIRNYLATEDKEALKAYSGELFRARFTSRLWMRRLISATQQPLLLEAGCALVRVPPFNALAWHVFFGRGSFPDVEVEHSAQLKTCKAAAP